MRVKRLLVLDIIAPFRRRAAAVAGLALLDTVLTSLGIGMVLPVFQSLLDDQHKSSALAGWVPFLNAMAPDMRLVVLASATILLFLVRAVVGYLAFHASHEFVLRLRLYWIARIGEHYLYGPHLRIVSQKQGLLLNDWFNETYAASRYLLASFTLFSSAVLTLALIALGFTISWQVSAAVCLLGLLLVLGAQKTLFGTATQLSTRKVQVLQAITGSMLESLTNIRDLKLMQAERARLAELAARTESLKAILLRGAVLGDLPRIGGEFLAVFVLMAFLALSALFTDWRPQTVVPMLAFVFVLFHRLLTTGSQFASARTRALTDVHSARLVHDLASQAVEIEDRDKGLPITSIQTDIRFEGITFTYGSERPALSEVDAIVPRGKRTFVLGGSGAGKSTLLDVLLRLVEPGAGCIVANGRSASEFNVTQWRRCFGYVSQDAALFNGSIRMNLQLARPGATDAEMADACRLAGATPFIAQLPDGYDTSVGDRGQSLSGGQRKRVAIARALMNKPSVLILDEATSAFEQNLETEILDTLAREIPDLTIIQVTHRPSAGRARDWVIALEGGRVVATGLHAEVSVEQAVPLP